METTERERERDPIENFPIKRKCGKIASNEQAMYYIYENHSLSLLCFLAIFFSPFALVVRIARVRIGRKCVYECVALNAIASRLREYFVFSCNLTQKRTSHRSVRQYRRMDENAFKLPSLSLALSVSRCEPKLVCAGVQRFRAIYWVLFHTLCVHAH